MSEIKNFVSFSSLLTAARRAIETEGKNPLFQDPFARQLAGEEAFAFLDPKNNNVISEEDGRPYLAVRTRFFDDFIIKAVSQCNQIVILGAGMDTRAFRLNVPENTHIYEVD